MLQRPRLLPQAQRAAQPPLLDHAVPFSPQPAGTLHSRQPQRLKEQNRTMVDRNTQHGVTHAEPGGRPRGFEPPGSAQVGNRGAPQGSNASQRPWPQVCLTKSSAICCRMHDSNNTPGVNDAMAAAWLHTAGGPAPEGAAAEAPRRGVAAEARCCLWRGTLSAEQGLRGAQRASRCPSSTDTCAAHMPV